MERDSLLPLELANAAARRFPLTDLGNAERLADAERDDLRFALQMGWHFWDGRRWLRDDSGEVNRRAKRRVRAIFHEAANPEISEEEKNELVKHALRSESAPSLRRMVNLAESEPELVIRPDALDCDPFLLNVENGTLQLDPDRAGELRPHRRGDYITQLAPVEYRPAARHPVFDRFCSDTFGNDRDLAAFVQRAMGYSLLGVPGEEVLFFAHGPAATGKSTLLDAVKAALGEYLRTADFSTFLKRRGDGGIPNGLARLKGARIVSALEVDEGRQLAEGVVKAVTGGDAIAARFLFREFFEYVPQFTLWLAANARPRVSSHDSGLWRRIRLIPFVHVVPEHQRDPLVKRTLKRDPDARAAVLAWMVEGLLAYHANGLQVPERVSDYTRQYRTESDLLGSWIADECTVTSDAEATAGELRNSYVAWCSSAAVEPLSPNEFAAELRARGCEARRRHGGKRVWRGIELRR